MASATISQHSQIEIYFRKLMNPLKKDVDPNLVAQFCQKLNNDLDGVSTAVHLITSKMQSEHEWESLIALYVLEACVKNCGEKFHVEISKFRFLNEMIKLVSPKYLADKTTDRVKLRCIEILFSWTKCLPNEAKIQEAYQMLKRQGIVDTDPVYVDTKLSIHVTPREKNPIFDDPYKSKKLSKLLQSKNPQDIEEANRLIKQMVQQEEMKSENVSTRISELEHLNDNIKLLTDMLFHYNKSTVNQSETETMKLIYDELAKKQPNLIQLAAETDDNDEGIGEIIKTNDNVIRVLTQYRQIFDGGILFQVKHDFNDDMQLETLSKSYQLISTETQRPLVNYDPFKELEEVFGSTNVATSDVTAKEMYANYDDNEFGAFTGESHLMPLSKPLIPSPNSFDNLLNDLSLNGANQMMMQHRSSQQTNLSQSAQAKTTPQSKAIEDLNQIGRTMLEQTLNLSDKKTQSSSVNNLFQSNKKPLLTLNEIQQQKCEENKSHVIKQDFTDVYNAFNSIFVPIESIKLGKQKSITIYEANDIKVVLHFGRDCPHVHCSVIVVSISSTNSDPVNRISFEAAVAKTMRVKLQVASSTHLMAYNPILPSSPITQVMLIANPSQEKVRLRFKLSYAINDRIFNESGDIDALPLAAELI